jgi:hypothetical protein
MPPPTARPAFPKLFHAIPKQLPIRCQQSDKWPIELARANPSDRSKAAKIRTDGAPMWKSSESVEFSLPNLMARCREENGIAVEANASVARLRNLAMA